MPKETKGQKVKSFTAYVPQPDLTTVKTVISVYFQGKDSSFHATLPPHIVEGVGHHPDRTKKMRGNEIVTPLADEVEPAFTSMLKLFERIQQNAVKKKVIQIHVSANGRNSRAFKSITFAHGGGPALSFAYRVLWEINGGLYSEGGKRDDDTPYLTYITAAPTPEAEMTPYQRGNRESFVIDWTEEREAFVKNIHDGLETLIQRLGDVLLTDTAQNIDRLITGGGSLMLPAPQKDFDETIEDRELHGE